MEIRKRDNQQVILRKNGTLDISSINKEKSLTQQQYKESTDVNNIVKQYEQTGVLPTSNKVAQFMDVSDIQDYQKSLETVYEAQKAFDALPAAIRNKMDNDPAKLIAFLEDDKNLQEAINLGLINKPNPKPNESNEPETQSNTNQASQPASVPS